MATKQEQNQLWDAVEVLHHYYEDLFRPIAASFDLTTGQLRVLHTLHRFGSLNVGELALVVGMARTNMSALCKKLTKQGYLVRHKGESGDERQVTLELTPEGESAARQAEGLLDSAACRVKDHDLSAFLKELCELSHSLSPQGEQLLLLKEKPSRLKSAGQIFKKASQAILPKKTKKELQHGNDF